MDIVSPEEMNRITGQNGEVRGVVLCTDAGYVRRHADEDALRLVEDVTAELGCRIKYRHIKTMEWYPAYLRGISLLAVMKALGWSGEQLRAMGKAAPRYSIITKLMLRYFVSLTTLIEKLPIYWRKNYSVGSLTGKITNDTLVLHIRDIEIPRQVFPYMEGFFIGVITMIVGNDKNIKVEYFHTTNGESKCYEIALGW